MRVSIERKISEDVRVLLRATQTPINGEVAAVVKQRAEGEFLEKLLLELKPMLRKSMRSHRIAVASGPYGVVALKSDGIFVQVGTAGQEDLIHPMEVLSVEPDLLTILDRIEAELVDARDTRATSAANVVHLARAALTSSMA